VGLAAEQFYEPIGRDASKREPLHLFGFDASGITTALKAEGLLDGLAIGKQWCCDPIDEFLPSGWAQSRIQKLPQLRMQHAIQHCDETILGPRHVVERLCWKIETHLPIAKLG